MAQVRRLSLSHDPRMATHACVLIIAEEKGAVPMTRRSCATLALLLVLPLALSAQEQLSPPQQGYTFQVTNLRWFGISIWDNDQAHAMCRAECAQDPNCRAYSFVLIGGYNPNEGPVCYLMAHVEQIVPHACCIIGMKPLPPSTPSHQPSAGTLSPTPNSVDLEIR